MNRTPHLILCSAFILMAVTFSPVFGGECCPSSDYLTGDWAGARTRLHEKGIDFGLNYTAEPAASVAGGYRQDGTYLHNIGAELKMDLDKLVRFKNTTFLMKYSSRSGDNLSEKYVVPASTEDGRYNYGEYYNKSQEAYGGQTTKLVNFQLTTQVTPQWQFDYGRLVMNDLFLRSDLYCNFINNALCGSPKGVFTPYALSAYPDATAGIHVRYRANTFLDLKAGVFDGGWMKQYPNGWDWTMGKNGAAFAGEAQIYFDRADAGGTPRVVKFGVNEHTGNFNNFKTGGETSGQTSLYVLTDWMLMRESGSATQGLSFLGALVWNANDEIAALPLSGNLGLVYEGLIPTRDRDKMGLMFTQAGHSQYNTYSHDYVSNKMRTDETIFELDYNIIFDYGIQVMPTVQYILHPNGSQDFGDATVIGLKLSISL